MNTENRIGKWSIIIGIVIVLNLFFNYTLSLVYDAPDYEVYCPTQQVVTMPETQTECTDQGGQWTENSYYGKPVAPGVTEPMGYCDLQYTCRQTYESDNDSYNRNVFVVLVVLGALSVLAGNFLVAGNSVIASGLSLGGVLSFVIASMRYWSSADDIFRVVILAIALGLLFWVAMKKFGAKQ